MSRIAAFASAEWSAATRADIVRSMLAAIPHGTDGLAAAGDALLRVPGVAPRINRRYAALIAGSHSRTFDNAPEEAPFESMRQLPAGHYLELTNGTARLGRYWQLSELPELGESEAALAERY